MGLLLLKFGRPCDLGNREMLQLLMLGNVPRYKQGASAFDPHSGSICFGGNIDIVALSSIYRRFSGPLDCRYIVDISTIFELYGTFFIYYYLAW